MKYTLEQLKKLLRKFYKDGLTLDEVMEYTRLVRKIERIKKKCQAILRTAKVIMMSWRPEKGWAHQRSEYFERNQQVNHWQKTRQKDYEAGADAIIKSLKKAGSYGYSYDSGYDDCHTVWLENGGELDIENIAPLKVKGWLVFIPEEDNEKNTDKKTKQE